jgi:hypothetical protein
MRVSDVAALAFVAGRRTVEWQYHFHRLAELQRTLAYRLLVPEPAQHVLPRLDREKGEEEETSHAAGGSVRAHVVHAQTIDSRLAAALQYGEQYGYVVPSSPTTATAV